MYRTPCLGQSSLWWLSNPDLRLSISLFISLIMFGTWNLHPYWVLAVASVLSVFCGKSFTIISYVFFFLGLFNFCCTFGRITLVFSIIIVFCIIIFSYISNFLYVSFQELYNVPIRHFYGNAWLDYWFLFISINLRTLGFTTCLAIYCW